MSLPIEILNEIFSYLASIDQVHFVQVCKEWRVFWLYVSIQKKVLVKSIIKHPYGVWLRSVKISNLIPLHENIHSVYFSSCFNKNIKGYFTPNVKLTFNLNKIHFP